jgi:ribulose bisphosphate carboxylase small subunit
MVSCSSDSEPSFDSPSEDDDDDEDEEFDGAEDEDDDEVGIAPPPSKSFRGPLVDSQEESVAGGSPLGLATQPCITATTQQSKQNKKRKVSLSPRDSLAQAPPRRKSPRSTTRAPVNSEGSRVIELLDGDEHDAVRKPMSKKARRVENSSKSTLEDEEVVSASTQTTTPNRMQGRQSLKTTLFPEEEMNVENSTASKQPTNPTGTKDASDKKLLSKNEKEPQKATPPISVTKPVSIECGKLAETTKPPNASKASTTSKKPISNATKPSESAATPMTTSSTSTVVPVQPPKTKKKKKSFQDELLHLMFMTCKPYTVKCLAVEMKGASESAIEFCFLSLVDKGWVIKKEFASKSRTKDLYWGNQECKNKELMDILDMVPPQKIQQARQEVQQLQQTDAQVSRELAVILQEPSNEELNAQLQQSELQVQELERRLKDTQERVRASTQTKKIPQPTRPGFGLGRKMTPAKPICSKRLKQKINGMRLHWKKRKEKCTDFVENLSDAMEKKPKEVEQLLQLETDEMVGVTMPPKHDQI